MMLCPLMFGQYHWPKVEDGQYSGNMQLYAFVSIENVEQVREDLEIAAFYNGTELRGRAKSAALVKIEGVDHRLFILTIHGSKEGEQITFKLYDHSAQKELVSKDFVKWTNGGLIGKPPATPKMLDFYNVYWENYEQNYDYNQQMTVTAKIHIDGVEQKRTNLEIAAFYQDELRGRSVRPVQYGEDYLVDMFIYGNGYETEPIKFRLYDHSGAIDVVLISEYTADFVGDAIIGLDEPVVMNFITPYVARIGDVKYETLQAAVDAYNAGEIVILKNAQSDDATTIGKNVTIDFAGFTYDGTLELNNATLNVVREDVTKEGTATSMVLNEGAQVYHSYALATTIVRNVEGTASGWGTLSAPTAEGDVVFNTNTTGKHDFYQYYEPGDENGLEWVYIGTDANPYKYPMEVGRGYLYANSSAVEMSFKGTLNMESVVYDLSYTGDKVLAGFNMIGNPYTHNINLNHLDGEIADAFYSVGLDGAWVPNVELESPVIAPFQAVLVQTNAANKTVTINKTENNTEATARNASEGILKINVANNSYNDVAYVLFEEGIGLRKIGHFNEEIPMVSVSVEDKEYAVATMSKDVTEIPVSFKAMTMGQYTISVEAKDCEFDAMYLTDKLTGEKVNLNTESYTFMATSNDNPNRFVLTMTKNTTGIEQNTECFVYVSNEEIRFNNINGQVNVRIYDMLGRPVAEYDVYESATISTSSFERGMYILQMTDENGVRTQKVLVD